MGHSAEAPCLDSNYLPRMFSLICVAALIAVTAGQQPPPGYLPPPPPGYAPPRPIYGRPRPPIGPLGGGLDPLTFLLFQNGGSGSGDLQSILPFLLLGGGGLGGHPGKGGLGGKGGLNPLLLSSLLGKCEEPSGEQCTPPNNDDGLLCGINQQEGSSIKRCCSCTNKKSSSSLLPFLL